MLVRAIGNRLVFGLFVALSVNAAAQSSDAPPPPDQPSYTLHVNTRVVLTDVTVTDARGNPIRGLKPSDFQILDNGHSQKLSTFQEHVETQTPVQTVAAKAAGVFSNDSLLHLPSTVNVILIDTTTIQLIDQMFLYQQLTRFVQNLPPGEPVAIFNRAGQATLLLQNFTSDHQLLLSAIREAVPYFVRPDAYYTSGTETLQQMAAYLHQIPGRKNVLWFSGGSNALLFLNPQEEEPRREIYDTLEADRIALYPIDARGLTVYAHPPAQQLLMEQDAEATGGHAYYNSNGLAQITSHVVDTDGTFYTLTYSPDDVTHNGKWHKVKVQLADTRYQLSYRHGYYDDGHTDLPPATGDRSTLRADGSTAQKSATQHAQPIIFQARILPASQLPAQLYGSAPIKPKRGETTYTVHFDVPVTDVQTKPLDDKNGIDLLGVGILAFNRYGTPIGHDLKQIRFTLNQSNLRNNPNARLAFDQQVNLPKGEDHLYIAVWDPTTGRLGTLNLPLEVKKQSQPTPQP